MKAPLFVALLLCTFLSTQLQAQDEHLQLGKVTDWHINTTNFGFNGEYWLSYFGDTTIAGNTYRKIGDPEHVGILDYFYLREDVLAKKVYRYWPNEGFEDLYYDFTLEVGDVIEIFLDWQMIELEVKSIDIIMTASGERKSWLLDPSVGGPSFYVLEGIGGSPLNYETTIFISDPVYSTTCAYSYCKELMNNADCTPPVYPNGQAFIAGELCEGQAIIIDGDIYYIDNPSGQTVFVGMAENGCDSVVNVELTFIPTVELTPIDTTICPDDEIVINGTSFNINNQSGTIYFENEGCDSIQQVNLSFYPACITSAKDVEALRIALYPNPTQSMIHLDAAEQIDRVEVYNSVGQLVLTRINLPVGVSEIDLGAERNGIYFVKVLIGEKTGLLRVVKE